MKECYYHPGIPAAGQCDICGHYVCAGDLQPTTTAVGYKPGTYNPLQGKTVCKFCLEKLAKQVNQNVYGTPRQSSSSYQTSRVIKRNTSSIILLFLIPVIFFFIIFFFMGILIVGIDFSSGLGPSSSLTSFNSLLFMFLFMILLFIGFIVFIAVKVSKQKSKMNQFQALGQASVQTIENELNKNKKW